MLDASQEPSVEGSLVAEDRTRRQKEPQLVGSSPHPVEHFRTLFKQSVNEKVGNGDVSMERSSPSLRPDEQSSKPESDAVTARERLNDEGSRNIYAQRSSSEEPEPSSVAARLRKEALDNPQEEQSVEDLLSSLGVSLLADQRMLDYSMAVEYSGPTFRDGVLKDKPPKSSSSYVEESGNAESIPVAIPLALPRRKPFRLNNYRSMVQSGTESRIDSSSLFASSEETPKDTTPPPIFSTVAEPSEHPDFSEPEPRYQSEGELNVSKSLDSGVLQDMAHSPSKIPGSPPNETQKMANGSSGKCNHLSAQDLQMDKQGDGAVRSFSIDVFSDSIPATGIATSPILNSVSPVSQRPSSWDSRASSGSGSPSQSEISSVSGPVAVDSLMETRVHSESNRSGADADIIPGVLNSPVGPNVSPSFGSFHTGQDGYAHESFESVEERSELVNIPDHGGNRPTTPPVQPRKRGGCARCGRGNLLLDKEYCMACGVKYCGNCVLSAMGSMPEGRKCLACLGQPISGSRRPNIGKPSRLLKHMLSPLEVQQIMKAERECPANQLRAEQVWVNNRQLSHDELAILLGCCRPPGKLKPGRYWYDGVTGLWGKDGHRPDRIVSPSLKVGGALQPNASSGRTQVFMNNRELGRLELKMLKLAGVNCVPGTHLWVDNDGSYSEEGFKNVKGNIWGKQGNLLEKASIKLLYPFFSLPTPCSNEGEGNGSARHFVGYPGLLDPLKVHKLLLLGHEGSGRSTIYKQAKILYKDGFTKEDLISFKYLIQANIYRYMATLLEGRERFEEEEEDLADLHLDKQLKTPRVASLENSNVDPPIQPGILNWSDDRRKQKLSSTRENIYRLEPELKQVSDWFMENMSSGNVESAITPSAANTQEKASKIEQLWLSSAIQSTFGRRSELPFLPEVASLFLNRVVEVCKNEYEPSETDILQTEGLSQGSGLVHIEISLEDKIPYSGSWQDNDTPSGLDRYQVIRVGGKGMSDRHKWLDMFEDVRAVVFCVALSDYDSLWNESSGIPSNKMIQTRDLFESILRHPCFQDTPFVLLLNKYDVFEEKIERGVPLTACAWFSDFRPVGTSHYTAQNQAQQAYQYIAHKYKELFNSVNCTGRKLFTFQLNALDKTTVSGAFQYVKEILKWEEHKAAGWGMIPEDLSYSTEISSFSHRSMPRQPEVPRKYAANMFF